LLTTFELPKIRWYKSSSRWFASNEYANLLHQASCESKVRYCATYQVCRDKFLLCSGGKCVRKHASERSADAIQFIVGRINAILLDFS